MATPLLEQSIQQAASLSGLEFTDQCGLPEAASTGWCEVLRPRASPSGF